jgi:cysteine synthase A
MRIAKDMTELVGKTPLVRLNRMAPEGTEVLVKLESFNPGGSVKDRVGLNMILFAEKEGLLRSDSVIVEPTSGNTGIALAWVCAVKGYRLILTMPESMSKERVALLKGFGAEVELTPAHLGMIGAIEKARELASRFPHSFIPQQFKNAHNPEIHRHTTALEIWEDAGAHVDIFITAVGTGGTITGVGEVLKQKNPSIKIIAVEPKDSAVLSGNPPGPHMIQGIGAGFIPDILNQKIYEEIILVSNEDAFRIAALLAKKEGILCGISSGANVFAALKVAERKENFGKRIVTMICDTGERYLSTALFN